MVRSLERLTGALAKSLGHAFLSPIAYGTQKILGNAVRNLVFAALFVTAFSFIFASFLLYRVAASLGIITIASIAALLYMPVLVGKLFKKSSQMLAGVQTVELNAKPGLNDVMANNFVTTLGESIKAVSQSAFKIAYNSASTSYGFMENIFIHMKSLFNTTKVQTLATSQSTLPANLLIVTNDNNGSKDNAVNKEHIELAKPRSIHTPRR